MRCLKLIAAVSVLVANVFGYAAYGKSPDNVIQNYKKVPPVINYYPYSDFSFDDKRLKWVPSNNLARKTGSAVYATGDPLFLEGYVADIDGIPIDNVTVKIVQSNSNGVYNHMVNKKDALYDDEFSANGIAITDNRGYYRFVTVFPGYYNNRAPHIHVQFEHPKHGMIETEIFFKDHPRNLKDPKYKKLTKAQQKLVTADAFYINKNDHAKGKKAVFNVIFNSNQITKDL